MVNLAWVERRKARGHVWLDLDDTALILLDAEPSVPGDHLLDSVGGSTLSLWNKEHYIDRES